MPEEQKELDNVIFIGKKPVMVYVMSVAAQADKGSEEIILKARGRSISTAVDVAQVATRRSAKDYEIGVIKTGTEEMEVTERREEGPGRTYRTMKLEKPEKINISTIEIPLIKKK